MPWDPQLPLHAKVYRGLSYAIDNYFKDGDRFFTEKKLIAELKVSQVTVRRAVYDLARNGMLKRAPAKGTFVQKPQPKKMSNAQSVAIHLEDWESSFLSGLLRQLLSGSSKSHLQPQVYYSNRSGGVSGKDGESWNQADVGGAILLSLAAEHVTKLSRLYLDEGKTVVCVDSRGPGEVHYVGTDNLAVTQMGLNHLVGLGHRNICLLINEPEEHGNVRQRIEYFERLTGELGLTDARVWRCGAKFWDDSYKMAYEAMPRVMALNPRPTVIFAFDDPGAWAVLKWCAQNGVRVPQDLSVLGFANDKPSEFTIPALTTIAHPIEEIVATALELLKQPAQPSQTRLLAPKFVLRESTLAVK